MISMQENMSARTLTLSSSAQRTIVRFVKLPLVDKIPLHTAWISLEKYG
jgi:[histone H3]-lysine27 N-trimethyltransferase EZH2